MDRILSKIKGLKTLSAMLISLALLLGGCVTYEEAGSPKVAEPGKVLKKITEVRFTEDSETVSVWITGNQVLTYTSVKQPFPAGVILYFPDTALEGIEQSLVTGSDVIESVRATELTGKGHTSRIGILLKSDMAYDVSREGLDLKVSFAKMAADMPAAEAVSAAEPAETEMQAAAEEAAPATAGEMWGAATLLTGIDTEEDEDGVAISINADGTIKDFDAFTIKNPARIVVDMYGVNSAHDKEQTILVNSESVRRVRHYKSPDKLRVVIDTKDALLEDFTADTVEMGLLVKVGTGAAASMESSSMEGEQMPQEAAATAVAASEPPKPAASAQKPAWINRIDFSSEESGKSTVILGTTRPITYQMEKIGDLKLQLRMFHANLPGYRQRPLITTRFESAVDRIMPVQTAAMQDTSVITFELRESVPYYVEQVDDILFVHFDPSTVPPKPVDEAELPSWQKVIAQAEQAGLVEEPAAAETPEEAELAPAMEPTEEPAEEPGEAAIQRSPLRTGVATRKYTGEKIALDFYETDIKNVFRILREVSGKNYAIDKDVTGRVTLTLRKPVPWDQVLDLILRMNSLGMVYEDDIVRIATLATLQQEESLRQAALEAAKRSREAEKALEPLVTAYIPINYSDATADILPHLQNIITEGRGTLSVHTATNQIIIKDVAAKVEEAKILVSKLDIVTAQVLIEARVVEATNTFKKELGTVLAVGVGPITQHDGNNQTYDFQSNFPRSSKSLFDVTWNKVSGTPATLNAKINALEEEGESKTISSPKVLTLDNKPATIKQGVSYPINKLDADGNSTTEFKDIVLELTVTPHVTMDGRVSLVIKITKNDLGALVGSNFSFTVNEANTELLVNDGDTIVIGGVTKTTDTAGEEGVPGLRKIPGLGWLFGSKAKDKSKNELLIFITPKIVKLD